ncbi:MAG: hypothetical protein QOI86_5182 [Actinomycetota bacterium]|nr:hypothetical protein [Actinomycetota bacterium]
MLSIIVGSVFPQGIGGNRPGLVMVWVSVSMLIWTWGSPTYPVQFQLGHLALWSQCGHRLWRCFTRSLLRRHRGPNGTPIRRRPLSLVLTAAVGSGRICLLVRAQPGHRRFRPQPRPTSARWWPGLSVGAPARSSSSISSPTAPPNRRNSTPPPVTGSTSSVTATTRPSGTPRPAPRAPWPPGAPTVGPLEGGALAVGLLDQPLCLGTTRRGEPRHPLYVPQATEPAAYATSDEEDRPA